MTPTIQEQISKAAKASSLLVAELQELSRLTNAEENRSLNILSRQLLDLGTQAEITLLELEK